MTNKKWNYHKSHSFVVENKKMNCVTQLYQIGVYGIINGDSSIQFIMSPASMVTMERKMKKNFKKGNISDLEFGVPITVTTDDSGMYVEFDLQ